MSAPKGTRPPNAGRGRRKGVPNKVTADMRSAFTLLAQRNVDRLQEWFDAAAAKDPARALDLFLRLAEFIAPKLARTELAGPEGAMPVTVHVTFEEGRVAHTT